MARTPQVPALPGMTPLGFKPQWFYILEGLTCRNYPFVMHLGAKPLDVWLSYVVFPASCFPST